MFNRKKKKKNCNISVSCVRPCKIMEVVVGDVDDGGSFRIDIASPSVCACVYAIDVAMAFVELIGR